MRKLTRSILAATAVAGLLTVPVAGAGAVDDSTTTQLTLTGVVGTLSITAPTGTPASPVNLGDLDIAAGVQAADNALGGVTVSDTTTGLLREATITVDTGFADGTTGFCQDDDGNVTGGVVCSGGATETILKTNVGYDFAGVTESGDAVGDTVEIDGALGAASAVFTATGVGSYQLDWTPVFNITLLGTESAGTYYGEVKHTVTAVSL